MGTASKSLVLVLVALSLTCLVTVPSVILAETQVTWAVQTADENGTILPLIESSQIPATQWNKTFDFYSGDLKHCAIQTSDGGYAVIGLSGGYYSSVVLAFAKVDPRGSLVWEQKISSLESAGGVVQTSDGGYVIAGNTGHGVIFIKTGSQGNVLWNQTYAVPPDDNYYSNAHDIIKTSDGGFILAGDYIADHENTYTENGFLLKTDATGKEQWIQNYGGSGSDSLREVFQTADGQYVAVGTTTSFGAGGTDAWLIKTDALGRLIWSRTFGSGPNLNSPSQNSQNTGDDEANSVVQTDDGGYAVCGHTNSYGAGGSDAWLIKTDATGKMEWNKTYGREMDDSANAIIQTSDGALAFAGSKVIYAEANKYQTNLWLVKTDLSGSIQWQIESGGIKVYNPWAAEVIAQDIAYTLIETSDGGFAVAGSSYHSDSIRGAGSAYLAKLSAVLPPPTPRTPTSPTNSSSTPISPSLQLPTITIQPDGSIDPPNAPVTRQGNVYTLNENINGALIIKKENITIDGAGHVLKGSGKTADSNILVTQIGINLTSNFGVTIENFQLTDYVVSIRIENSSWNSISRNSITGTNTAIHIIGNSSNNKIDSNNLQEFQWRGISLNGASNSLVVGNTLENGGDALMFLNDASGTNVVANTFTNNSFPISALYYNSISDTLVYRNNIVGYGNAPVLMPFNGTGNHWDNGALGNYWSNYKGVDSNHDGVGDTPYQFSDTVNGEFPNVYDHFPLMAPISKDQATDLAKTLKQQWNLKQQIAVQELMHPSSTPPLSTSILIIGIAVTVGAGLLVYFRKHKPNTELDKKP